MSITCFLLCSHCQRTLKVSLDDLTEEKYKEHYWVMIDKKFYCPACKHKVKDNG